MSGEEWTPSEMEALEKLDSPAKIQAFLDDIPYSDEPVCRCPRSVLRDHKANCFDGAVFGAMALRRLGHEPLLLDMRAVRDDDHVIALYRKSGHLGAVAKSNFVGLRFREPIHRTLRELMLSYFEQYYNVSGEKTLRSYSLPFRLSAYDVQGWTVCDETMELIAVRLDRTHHIALITRGMARALSKTDDRSLKAGLLGANEAGLYKP